VAESTISDLDLTAWHNLSITVNEGLITAFVDGEQVLNYEDTDGVIFSGRAALYSSYQNNYYDNLVISAGENAYITRYDDLDALLTYSAGDNKEDTEGWYHNTMCSFKNYNRTLSTGSEGDSFEFKCDGTGFAIIGTAEETVLSVEIDGEAAEYAASAEKEREAALSVTGLEAGEHTVKVTIASGSLAVDAVEIVKAE